MDIADTLTKWNDAKRKIQILEERIDKYKSAVTKEMNRKEVDKLSANGFTVTRRRQTKTYLSKDSVPANIWNEYATKCSYDVFLLSKNK